VCVAPGRTARLADDACASTVCATAAAATTTTTVDALAVRLLRRRSCGIARAGAANGARRGRSRKGVTHVSTMTAFHYTRAGHRRDAARRRGADAARDDDARARCGLTAAVASASAVAGVGLGMDFAARRAGRADVAGAGGFGRASTDIAAS
jgi:hypothetical protein